MFPAPLRPWLRSSALANGDLALQSEITDTALKDVDAACLNDAPQAILLIGVEAVRSSQVEVLQALRNITRSIVSDRLTQCFLAGTLSNRFELNPCPRVALLRKCEKRE